MRKLFFALSVLVISIDGKSQNPVKWSYTAVKTGNKMYEVQITATIDQPWHIYSQSSPEGGALPTRISFNKNPLADMEGKPKEVGKLEEKYEKVFGLKLKYYSNKVVFIQKIKVKAAVKTNITGKLEFMVCNDEQCLPPGEISFSVTIQ